MSVVTASDRLPTGVVVTYHPPEGLAQRLRETLAQVDRLIVVDNGSASPPTFSELPTEDTARIERRLLPRNVGLAAALNRGIECARAAGATRVLLLDHDSTPHPAMVTELLAAMRAHTRPVALAAPRIAYAHPAIRCRWPASRRGQRWWFRFAYAATLEQPLPVDLAIGSGMLLDVDAWAHLGGFDESLFIDLVDTEFCLRARRQGYDVLAVPRAVLAHTLGHVEQRHLLGMPVYPTHHNALRHYYLSRNRILLSRRYALRFPNWFFYETMSALKLTIKVALYEPGRGAKLASMWRGTLDGLRGRRTAVADAASTPGP
ncbi:glycosyltransferase family 2 protein [Sinimarinibacterium flocculans]|uniref:glycosyltransferase family 2 protein n=1 Tax=Sinimarinibacterium flocculans TaxID=985250 RepID=UPI0035146895